MSMPTAIPQPVERENYLNKEYGVWSWLLTTDHKRIALLYLLSITFFFFIGGFFALLIRLELLTPAGDLVQADTYNKLFTMHGMVMVFFFLIPSIPAVLGNFLVPMMIGAKDLAFPRINLLSWYLYIIGGVMMLHCMLTGGVDTGWTFYAPFSTNFTNTKIVEAGLAIFVAGFSSILTGLNFVVTIHRMRAPGMTWSRLPLFIWAHYATSIIQLLGTPVVAVTIVLVAAERALHLGIFDPKLGGDPLLFQHLFWFYSHPAVYIMILPSMGVVTEIIACFSRKRIFGYSFVAFSSIAIAVFGFLVWAHHMFVAGMSVYAALVFSLLSYAVAVPSAIKVFNWTATLYKGSIHYDAPMLYAFGFLGLFTIGGLTGLFLAALGINVHVTDTYFVVAHFHYIMVGGAVMGYLGGMHFWWPKISGKLVSRRLGAPGRADRFHRLQPHVLPAIPARLHGHAAALLRLQPHARISGAERAVDRRRHRSRRRISAAHGLFPLVDALRQAGVRQSVERRRTRMEDAVPAADLQLRRRTRRDLGSLQLRGAGRARQDAHNEEVPVAR